MKDDRLRQAYYHSSTFKTTKGTWLLLQTLISIHLGIDTAAMMANLDHDFERIQKTNQLNNDIKIMDKLIDEGTPHIGEYFRRSTLKADQYYSSTKLMSSDHIGMLLKLSNWHFRYQSYGWKIMQLIIKICKIFQELERWQI